MEDTTSLGDSLNGSQRKASSFLEKIADFGNILGVLVFCYFFLYFWWGIKKTNIERDSIVALCCGARSTSSLPPTQNDLAGLDASTPQGVQDAMCISTRVKITFSSSTCLPMEKTVHKLASGQKKPLGRCAAVQEEFLGILDS